MWKNRGRRGQKIKYLTKLASLKKSECRSKEGELKGERELLNLRRN